jgi:hypothetical protein
MRKLKLAVFCIIVVLLFTFGAVVQATLRYDQFQAFFGPNGFESGGGTGYPGGPYPNGGGQWFAYPDAQVNGDPIGLVWNQWFYDDPPSYDRYKTGYLYFYIDPRPGESAVFTIWGNYSVPGWQTGPPEAGGYPPGPGDEGYISRVPLNASLGSNELHFTISDFNPEWISIDAQGFNFTITGWVEHECLDKVPVPAAVLLLGSGLIGLVGFGRKLLG